MTAQPSHERNLLFAGLGLQLSLLTKEHLVRAFSEWILNKNLSLGEILVQQGAITEDKKKAIEGAIDAQIQNDGGEVQALASVKNPQDIESSLKNIDDKELQMTLSLMNCLQSRKIIADEGEPERTDIPLGLHQPQSRKEPQDQRFQRKHFLDAGNLGEIWFAKDEELNRTVVLKYIKAEQQGSSFTKALFILEGEVTGYLEHPAVVPVYSMGQDDKARNFYAMRYIRGRKLTRAIADYHALPSSVIGKKREALTELLQMFQTACLAIEYAHSKGVLHCDLKPDNIVVGPFGETLVIDWGLAMVTNPTSGRSPEMQTLEHLHNATASGEVTGPYSPSQSAQPGLHSSQGGMRKFVGGTPAYISPEQMRATRGGEVNEVTHACDIFSLGATLYHLLTSQAPYFPNKEKRESNVEFFQRIEKGAFPAPNQLNPGISKALEAVVLKAMAAKPEDRYGSARELAEEVKRWLADEPVHAYRETVLEKSRRWARNHRTTVVSGILLLMFLAVGGLSFGLVTQGFNEKLRKQERLANEQKDLAQKREAMAISAVKQYADAVEKNSDLKNRKELEPLRKELLKEPIRFFKELIDQLRSEKNPSEKSLNDLAIGLFNLAKLTAEIGNQEDGITSYAEAISIRESFVKVNSTNPDFQNALAGSYNNLASLYYGTNRPKEAEANYQKALTIGESLVKSNPTNSKYQSELASSHNNLGIFYINTTRQKEGEASFQKALGLQETIVMANPANSGFQNELARSHLNLANLYSATNRLKEAEASYQKALTLQENLVKANPTNSGFQNDLAILHNNLAALFHPTNRQKEAEVSLQKALALQETLVKANPTNSGYQSDLARSHYNLALVFSDTNRQKEAEASLQKALALQETLVKANPTNSGYQSDLARSHYNLALVFSDTNRQKEAEARFQKALAIMETLLKANPTNAMIQTDLANTKNDFANFWNDQAWILVSLPGKGGEDYQKGLLFVQEALKLDPQNGGLLNTLGVAQYRVKQFPAALETLQKSNEFNSKASGKKDPADLAFLAMTCHQLNKKAEAETYFKELQEAMKDKKNSENKEYQGFFKEAETLLKNK